jgi:hypothetical protein
MRGEPFYCWSCGLVRTRAMNQTPMGRQTCCPKCLTYAMQEKVEPSRLYTAREALTRDAYMLVVALRKCGLLVPQPCEACGALPTEGHHDDYMKPWAVRWLCHLHHTRADAYKRRPTRKMFPPWEGL